MNKLLLFLSIVVAVMLSGCNLVVNPPKSSVLGRIQDEAQMVTLTSDRSHAKIYYTLDGSDPISNGTLYTEPILIDYTMGLPLIEMCAVVKSRHGDYSEVAEFDYVVLGPGGGYVFYDCDADNNSGNADGLKSSECGWRYLEAAQSDIYGDRSFDIVFGCYSNDEGETYLYSNGGKTYQEGTSSEDDGLCTGTALGTGMANTIKLVNAMENSAYTDNSKYWTTSYYAAKLCADYENNGCDDWFLPSLDELRLMYSVFNDDEYTWGFTRHYNYGKYWSSSENKTSTEYAYNINFYNCEQTSRKRTYGGRVRPIRAFLPEED